MRVILFGPTGMLGQSVLRECLLDPDVETVLAVVRRAGSLADTSGKVRELEERGENPEAAQFFAGYGVREGGLPVERDIQFWIDVLEREGLIARGQLAASEILLVTGDDTAATN